MKSYQLGLYEKAMPNYLSLAEKLQETSIAGYDYLELSIDESDEKLSRLDWSNQEISDFRLLQSQIGIPVISICLSGHRKFPLGDPDKSVRSQGMGIMEKAIGLAAKLGVRIIQLAGYDVYYKPSNQETKDYFVENLRRSVDMAASMGVVLAFETMETDFMNTVEKSISFVDTINSPWLKIYPDLGNITNAVNGCNERVKEDLLSGNGNLVAMHLKETKPGIFRDLSYGEGHVDFLNGVKTALELGLRLFVGEFWHQEGDLDWKITLKENSLFLRKFLDAALCDLAIG